MGFNSIGEVNEVAIERWFHSFIHSFILDIPQSLRIKEFSLSIDDFESLPHSRSMISSCAIGNNEKRFTVALNWINWSPFEVFIHKLNFVWARTRLEDFAMSHCAVMWDYVLNEDVSFINFIIVKRSRSGAWKTMSTMLRWLKPHFSEIFPASCLNKDVKHWVCSWVSAIKVRHTEGICRKSRQWWRQSLSAH